MGFVTHIHFVFLQTHEYFMKYDDNALSCKAETKAYSKEFPHDKYKQVFSWTKSVFSIRKFLNNVM